MQNLFSGKLRIVSGTLKSLFRHTGREESFWYIFPENAEVKHPLGTYFSQRKKLRRRGSLSGAWNQSILVYG